MKVLEVFELVELYCQATHKWCIYLSTTEKYKTSEVLKAAPYLTMGQCLKLLGSNLILTFDTEEVMELCFEMTVGDDGPTKHNDYSGEVRVYALTFSNSGAILNENT